MPSSNITRDHRRFRKIVRGDIRENLGDYIEEGKMTGKQGDRQVEIPIPQIDLPKIKHNEQERGGVGQGEGEPGDILKRGKGEPGEGDGQAGQGEGERSRRVEVSYEEFAKILGERLELPNIEPKGEDELEDMSRNYDSIRDKGPESLMDYKRSYKEALKRKIASGEYDPDNPEDTPVFPIKDDKLYKYPEEEPEPEYNAAIIYIMDVSGSMGSDQRDIVQNTAFCIDRWLEYQYEGIEQRYIIHGAKAEEVSGEEFYRTSTGGGTQISSAYYKCRDILEDNYPASSWNTYVFQFSDGDNWSNEDTMDCVEMLSDFFLPRVNLWGYGQTLSPHGSGAFGDDLAMDLSDRDNLVSTDIEDKSEILDAIETFLGTDRS